MVGEAKKKRMNELTKIIIAFDINDNVFFFFAAKAFPVQYGDFSVICLYSTILSHANL